MEWLRRCLAWLRPRPVSLGERGEGLAAAHFRARGAVILARNWRSGRDELDLVALEGRVLVFVEVKTRTAEQGGAGWFAVDARKRRALRRAVRAWVRAAGGAPHTRFDVVEVLVCHRTPPRIVHHLGVPLLGRVRR